MDQRVSHQKIGKKQDIFWIWIFNHRAYEVQLFKRRIFQSFEDILQESYNHFEDSTRHFQQLVPLIQNSHLYNNHIDDHRNVLQFGGTIRWKTQTLDHDGSDNFRSH